MSTVTVSKYGADLGDQLGAVKPHVKSAAQDIAAKFGLTTMSGYRAGNSRDPAGHPSGLAIDIPATGAVGDAIASYAVANAAGLGVKYVIWQQRIWYPGKDWAAMAARTGDGDVNHLRHVHISFNPTGPAGGVTGGLLGALPNAAASVVQSVKDLNPLTAWPEQATAVGMKIAAVLAGLGLLLIGATRLVAPAVKGAVNDTMEVLT